MYIQDKPLICLSNDSNFFQTHGEAPRQIHSPKAYGAAIAAAGGIPMLTCEQCAEEMAELCDIAMEGDRAVGASFDAFEFTLGETIAQGCPACQIRFDRVKK